MIKSKKSWQYPLYGFLGLLFIYTSTNFSGNYLLKNYLSLLEIQLGIVIIYLFMRKRNLLTYLPKKLQRNLQSRNFFNKK